MVSSAASKPVKMKVQFLSAVPESYTGYMFFMYPVFFQININTVIMPKKHEFYILSESSFKQAKRKLGKLVNIDLCNESIAFTVKLSHVSETFINGDRTTNKDHRIIVIWHEKAHVNGIMDEEGADIWTMKHLNKKQQKILISEWKNRHGHEYISLQIP